MTALPPPPNLYALLDVPLNATTEEIRRAYRRKALNCHPDKSPGRELEFQAVQRASQILGNPKKRRVYDRYGDFGVSTLEMLKSVALVETLLNTQRLKMAWLVLLVVVLGAALVPFAVAFRVSGAIGTAWRWILLPLLFVLVAIMVLGGFLLFLSWKAVSAQDTDDVPDDADPNEEGNLNKQAFIVIAGALFILLGLLFVQTFLLMLRLDGLVRWSLWLIFLPYFLLETINLLHVGLSLVVTFVNWRDAIREAPAAVSLHLRHPKLHHFLLTVRWVSMRILFMGLLLVKLGHRPRVAWSVVFAPLYLVPTLSCLGDYFVDKSAPLDKRNHSLHHDTEGADDESPSPRTTSVQHAIYAGLVIIFEAFVFLLNLHLSYGRPRWSIVFTPVYMVAIFLFLVLGGVGIFIFFSIPNFAAEARTVGLSDVIVENGRGSPNSAVLWQSKLRSYLGPFLLRLR